MRLPFLVFLSLFANALYTPSVTAEPLEISPLDFSGFVYSRMNYFVFFYAPWCSHCVASKPEFQSIESHVPTLMVDASTPEAAVVRERYGIKAFPTFLLFENAQPKDIYTGYRTAEAFEQFLNEKVPKPENTFVSGELGDGQAANEVAESHDEL
jgi:hypothetical protein